MSAQLLAGGPVADAVLDDVKTRVDKLAAEGKTVGLGTILVGDDEASAGYVRKKHEMCEQLGVASHHIGIDAGDDPATLFDAVDTFNADAAVDAYLIQYPVADGFDFDAAVNRMDPDKDGDGLHPVNLGRLVLGQDGPVPATPAGIRAMLVHYGIDIAGKEVVIVGRGLKEGLVELRDRRSGERSDVPVGEIVDRTVTACTE
jgi:methylenetetrahydrofolate dehydrogenase (NADP+)/methenyltetrahydrofolate cyclohydrolase